MRVYRYIKRGFVMFLINKVLAGTNPRFFRIKAILLRSIGYEIGNRTAVVAPIFCTGKLEIGDNCWLGAFFTIHGNGTVNIGNNVDIGPDVTFLMGTHHIGDGNGRAGKGESCNIIIGDGCWIGGKCTFVNEGTIGKSTVIAACACVCKDMPDNILIGGVPARIIRSLNDE